MLRSTLSISMWARLATSERTVVWVMSVPKAAARAKQRVKQE